MFIDQIKIKPWDERRDLLIPGDYNGTLLLCLRHLLSVYQQAVKEHGSFFVALSGGSTPKDLYHHLCSSPYKEQIDWSKVWLFWSDERPVPPHHPDSNYTQAMNAGFAQMPIPKNQIHRMEAETEIEAHALDYEKKIQKLLKGRPFDLVTLGLGEDGHTASLFPHTEALKAKDRLVVANFVPQKNSWRMTFTFECINQAAHIAVYVFGANKKYILKEILKSPYQFERYPIQKIGTKEHKAMFIVDEAAAALLLEEK